jgi:hypothetical protein
MNRSTPRRPRRRDGAIVVAAIDQDLRAGENGADPPAPSPALRPLPPLRHAGVGRRERLQLRIERADLGARRRRIDLVRRGERFGRPQRLLRRRT